MTATAPLEELLHQTLDRLKRQEQRTEALEAALIQTPPPSMAMVETPLSIPWPTRRDLPAATIVEAVPDLTPRVRELEVMLAAAEQREREIADRLRAAAGLETVGRLVAGVAHDFNNLLTVIAGNAESIRDFLAADHPLRECAETITSAAHTAAGVTRQLVALGKPSQLDPCPVDVTTSVRTLERTLRRLTGDRVTLDVSAAASLPLIRVDPTQFDRVLLNLVVNARDAIPDGGTVTIRAAAAPVSPGRPGWPDDVTPGEFVAVTVCDTGIGMNEDVRSRMFETFFTTKGDRGTGLGLATVSQAVREAGGHIEVESSPGWGTSVRVFWPAYPEPHQPLRLRR